MADTTKVNVPLQTVTFTYRADRTPAGYYCSEPGDMSGEYVPVVGVQAVLTLASEANRATETVRIVALLEAKIRELADPQGRSVGHAFALYHLKDVLKQVNPPVKKGKKQEEEPRADS